MREIKFRAWDEEFGKIMYEFHTGYHVSMDYGVLKVGSKDGNDDWFELDVMQFTGFQDKNRKEIYEGDILYIPLYGNVIIVWNKDVCAFQYAYHAIGKGTYDGGRMTNTLYGYESEDKYEIIGNIYENKELLKK